MFAIAAQKRQRDIASKRSGSELWIRRTARRFRKYLMTNPNNGIKNGKNGSGMALMRFGLFKARF